MNKLSIQIASQTLYRPVTVTVLLPYTLMVSKGPFKVLYALHPAMESGGLYFERLGLSNQVDDHGLAIVAPDLGNGYFINSPYEKQADFLQDELIPVLSDMLPLSMRQEDNMLLGISMGAFGGAHWALSCPERFGRAAFVSGCFDASLHIDERVWKSKELRPLARLFNDRIMSALMRDATGNVFPEADIRSLYAQAASRKSLPRFALWYGDRDYLCIEQNEEFANQCRMSGIDVEVHVSQGTHDLAYWQCAVSEAFAWLMR